jgi:uncharacterized protein YndB with AHSA1/START domain
VILTVVYLPIVVLVFILVLAAFRPPDFRIERTAVLAAPPDKVFAQVEDFHRWVSWSPWEKVDPDMKRTYEGPASGVGAVYRWQGNQKIGKGLMTLLESRPDELIRIRLEFLKPFRAVHLAEFSFKPQEGGTSVTWSMSGKNNLMAKMIHLFINMDKMVGGDFAKGLAQLKSLVEKG